MRTYRPKGTIKAEEQAEKFTISNEVGEVTEFAAGDYLVVRDGKIFGMAKADFEKNFDLTKFMPKRKEGTTAIPRKAKAAKS